MAKVVFNRLQGINTSRSSMAMEKGEAEFLQNVRPRPYGNWAKRAGVRTALTSSDPIMAIFSVEFDTITIPLYQASGTTTFFPSIPIFIPGNFGQPDSIVYPSPTPMNTLDESNMILLQIERVMRAVSERYARVDLGVTWPNRLFNSSGGAINEAVPEVDVDDFYLNGSGTTTMPPDQFYAYDLYYHDTVNGNPVGTRAAALVNEIVTAIDNLAKAALYGRVDSNLALDVSGRGFDSGASTYYLWNNANIAAFWGSAAAPTATVATYRTVLTRCTAAVRKFKYIHAAATWTDLSVKDTLNDEAAANCDTAKTNVLAVHSSTTRGFLFEYLSGVFATQSATTRDYPDLFFSTSDDGSFKRAYIGSNRGKLRVDLRPYLAATSASVYVGFRAPTGFGTATYGQTRLNNAATSVMTPWSSETPTVLTNWTSSSYLDNSQDTPSSSGSCPLASSDVLGWEVADQACFVASTYNYNV